MRLKYMWQWFKWCWKQFKFTGWCEKSAGNSDTDKQQKIGDFDLTNDEFDDCNFKDPGLTSNTDFTETYDDGIDAQSNFKFIPLSQIQWWKALAHSFADIERQKKHLEF